MTDERQELYQRLCQLLTRLVSDMAGHHLALLARLLPVYPQGRVPTYYRQEDWFSPKPQREPSHGL